MCLSTYQALGFGGEVATAAAATDAARKDKERVTRESHALRDKLDTAQVCLFLALSPFFVSLPYTLFCYTVPAPNFDCFFVLFGFVLFCRRRRTAN
jgi:hypothetical protein